MSGSAALDIVDFVVGASASLVASSILASRVERVGGRFRASDALIGLAAALGADSPEITSSVSALRSGQHAVGIGVVLGSNVFNIAALLGLGAVVARRIELHRRVVVLEGVVALVMAALALLVIGGALDAGWALAVGLVAFGSYVAVIGLRPSTLARSRLPQGALTWLTAAVREEGDEVAPHPRPPVRASAFDLATIVGALGIVVVASIVMERAGVALGERYQIPTIVTGAVILAAVTSLPNAVAAIYLARKGRGAAVLSEAMNSNTLNVFVGLLIGGALIGLGPVDATSIGVAIWYATLTLAVLAAAFAFRGVDRRLGLLIIAAYVVFVIAIST